MHGQTQAWLTKSSLPPIGNFNEEVPMAHFEISNSTRCAQCAAPIFEHVDIYSGVMPSKTFVGMPEVEGVRAAWRCPRQGGTGCTNS